MSLEAPFPWFGGKRDVAADVWAALGNVAHYVEPFFGSGAVLLARPHIGKFETVNDLDGMLANFWRAIAADAQAVADHADWPCNEADLHARHLWLVSQRQSLTERLMGDPAYYDALVAGWWVWGACNWIGSGWCSGNGPWVAIDGVITDRRQLPHLSSAQGVNRQLPHLSEGRGVNRKLPHLSEGRGVNRKLPHLSEGRGVNRKLPH
ncbi:MAG: DNA adenine methylase, partial [Proteobacteria bacterium]|nr:DNA adenine methylase [Pseudomonadota bacterium]